MLSGIVCATSKSVTRIDPTDAGPPETKMVDGYGEAGCENVVQIAAVERYALAASLTLRTAVPGEPTAAPVSAILIVCTGSTSVSLQIVTLTVCVATVGLNVTACATLI